MDKEEKQLVKEIKNYKIPQDWHKCEMGKLFNFSGGLSFSRNNLSDVGFLYLHYGNIHTSRKNYINVKNEINVLPKLNIPLNDVKEESLLKHGDVVFVDASEDYEGTSKCVVIENSENIPFISGLHTIVAKSKGEIIRNDYKKYCFENWDIKRQFAFFVTGISVFGLNKTNIARIIIPVPSLLEQQKIAEILSICDKVIELKEKLIEQKKLQKKYLMQALLDPKSPNFRQLTGFKGEWQEVNLEDISEITTGKLDANAMTENGNYKFFTCAKESYLINKYAFDTEALLVSGNGANVGYVHYYKGKFNAYQRTYVIDKFKQNIILIKYMLDKFLKARIHKEKNEGNTPYIRLDTLGKMKIKLPLAVEQKSIVDVLSAADQEIGLLKKELEQQKLKKKALMQLLLTGKVRANVS
jgi:type I restriction enzyme S subunit